MKNNTYYRPFEEKDIPHLSRWINDEEVFKNLYILCYPMAPERVRQWYEKEKASNAQIFLFFERERETRPVGLGMVHYIHEKNRCAELSIIIDPDFFKQGFGTCILNTLIEFSFNVLNLHKIFVHCVEYNRKMISLLDKAGFVREGVFRKELYFNGTYHDIYRYGYLKAEHESGRAPEKDI